MMIHIDGIMRGFEIGSEVQSILYKKWSFSRKYKEDNFTSFFLRSTEIPSLTLESGDYNTNLK